MLKQAKQNSVYRSMIISCSSCQAKFRVDESRIGPDGKKVRCSKCGHVWRAMPEARPVLSVEQPTPVLPPPGEPVLDTPPIGRVAENVEQPADQAEPMLSARLSDEAGSSEDDDAGPDGLTEEQRDKLATVQKPKPHSRSWFKVLTVFIVVAGLLLLAQRMLPLDNTEAVLEPTADVGEVKAKRAPADPVKGGHIVGGELPSQ